MSIPDVGNYPFIQAAKYTPKDRSAIRFIVIHTMEAPQNEGRARTVANWFASSDSPQASAHLMIDPYEVVRGVHDKDWAWHAGQANGPSIGIEHAGYAYKTDWNTVESQQELAKSAAVVAQYCKAYGIDPVWLTAQDIRDGKSGITGHAECNEAFGVSGGHTDPGPNFPKQEYVMMVKAALYGTSPKAVLALLAGVALLAGAGYYVYKKGL